MTGDEQVDPVSLILAALAAGAVKGEGDAASAAVKDAYQRLNELVSARFAGKPEAQLALDQHSRKPDTWQAPLAEALADSGADADVDVIEAAQKLMELLDRAESRAGKYAVDVSGAQGVQIGDHNRQLNQFGPPPPTP